MTNNTSDMRRTPRRITRLIVAAHAGDETGGCGATLAKYRDESAVVVLAEADEDRSLQCKNAQVALGYPEVFFLGLPGGHIGQDMYRLVDMLGSLLAVACPGELYLPFPSVDCDRAAAHEAGMRTVRLAVARHHQSIPTVLLYDTEARNTWEFSTDVSWNRAESLGETEIDCQARATLAYASNGVPATSSVDVVKERAASVGRARGLRWAEQFAIVRSPKGRVVASRPDKELALTGHVR